MNTGCRSDRVWSPAHLPWVCTATFESDSSFSRHLPVSASPPLLCPTCEAAAGSVRGGLAKLAGAGRFQHANVSARPPREELSSVSQQRGPRRTRWEATTYFHLRNKGEAGCTTPRRPTTLQVPATQRTDGAAVLRPSLMAVRLTTVTSHFPRKCCLQVLLVNTTSSEFVAKRF